MKRVQISTSKLWRTFQGLLSSWDIVQSFKSVQADQSVRFRENSQIFSEDILVVREYSLEIILNSRLYLVACGGAFG
jgi:hypothetical protein